MRFDILIFLLLTISIAHSEEVDGPANFRGSPKGEVIASLNDKVQVIPTKYSEFWYKVEIPIYVKKENIHTFATNKSTDGFIKKNSFLYNSLDRVIGKTKGKAPFNFGADETADKYYGVIELYTFHKNIKKHTLVEANIEKLLDKNISSLNKGWAKLISYPNYQPWLMHKEFQSFIYLDPLALNINPEPRIILFFYKGKLFSILHANPIDKKYFTSSSIVRGYTMHYLPGFNAKIKSTFDAFYPNRISIAN